MMLKTISLLFLLFITLFQANGKAVAVFEKPQLKSRYLIIDDSRIRHTGKKVRLIENMHPLACIYNYHEVKLPNELTGYCRNDVVLSADGKRPEVIPEIPVKRLAAGIAVLLFIAWIGITGLRHGFKDWQILLLPVLVRILLSLILVSKWDGVFTAETDEHGYFETAYDMLHGVWNHPWRFTIGNGLLYMPFISLLNAEKFYDIVPYYNYFSLFFIAPGVLALGYLILRKLNVPGRRAGAAMMFYAVLPFVLFHSEEWSNNTFQHFFLHIQLFSRFVRLLFYSFCINAGFNAMSDTPGLLLVLGCIYFALTMKAQKRYGAAFGALFALACLVRINYIILAPVFAFMLYRKFAGKQLVPAAAVTLGAFIAVFGIQLVCNTIHFGSPLTFGYILHYTEYPEHIRPAAGFTWFTFKQLTHLRYLLQVNLPVFALGTAALWTMRDSFKQRILAWTAIPLILFFSGYSHTFCDGRRFVFPAFAALLMAVAAADFWKKLPQRKAVMLVLALTAMCVLILPDQAPWKGFPLLLGENHWILVIAKIIVPIWLFLLAYGFIRKGQLAPAAFVTLASIFYYTPVMVLAIGMATLLLWSVVHGFIPRDIKIKWFKKYLRLTEATTE